VVGKFVSEAVRGYSEAMLMTSIKHFPGHGDTNVDSHLGLPKIDYDEKRLTDVELKPFIKAIRDNAPGVMASHILFSQLDDRLPASLSEKIIDGLLRKKIGFGGLVVTDSLTMDAIFKNFTLEEIVIYGFNSGCDMFLLCGARDLKMQNRYYQLAIQYAKEGKIKMECINAAVSRILSYKEKFRVGVMNDHFEDIHSELLTSDHVALSQKISEESITMVKK
jgi:beta-N-acetylhexosaminidase